MARLTGMDGDGPAWLVVVLGAAVIVLGLAAGIRTITAVPIAGTTALVTVVHLIDLRLSSGRPTPAGRLRHALLERMGEDTDGLETGAD